jgi:tripartite-type tricarboxylate transporter receptor subunit TctC
MSRSSKDRWKAAAIAMCCAASLVGTGAAAQQAFPSRPIRWVVGYAAGGGSDFSARAVAKAWSQAIGQPVIIENKPGGNTALAAVDVAQSRPDGYTVGFVGNGTMAINPLLYKKLTYDPQTQFKAVTLIGRMPCILVVNPKLGIDTLADYVKRAKAQPGALTYSSPGSGNANHLAMEMFNGVAGISTLHSPYRGAAPAIADVVAGHVQAMMVDLATSDAFIRSGAVKALAVANATRLAAIPNVPTFIESGYSGFEAAALQGAVVPAKTSPEVIAELNKGLVDAIRSPAVSKQLLDAGIEPVGSTANEFDKILAQDKERWKKVIDKLKISLD